jgi:hypothetical protein
MNQRLSRVSQASAEGYACLVRLSKDNCRVRLADRPLGLAGDNAAANSGKERERLRSHFE